MRFFKAKYFLLVPVMLFSLQLSGCATNPVSGQSNFVLISEAQEVSLGEKAHEEILKQYKIYDHPALQQYIDGLGQMLVSTSHRSHLEYRFTLLDSPEVNAFALPGGYVYITRGILAYMNSEEELAGVLAHEIGHITARHGVRQHSAQVAAGLIGAIFAIATDNDDIARATSLIGGALVSGYGRTHELEADRLGAEYIARSGYDPQKMLDVIGILKDQEGFELQRAQEEGRPPRRYHGLFSTHPRNDKRLQEVVLAAAKYAAPNSRQTDTDVFLGMMDGITFGDSEDQGIVRENRFFHKSLDVTLVFPEGWRVENRPQQLMGLHQDSESVIIVRADVLQQDEDATEYLLQKYTNLARGRRLIDGGFTGVAYGDTPYGTRSFRVLSKPHGQEGVFFLLGFSKSGRPDSALMKTAESIRYLRQDERGFATARKIVLQHVHRGDNFSTIAAVADLGEYAEERLRLLNGMYPDGELQTGQLIKTVQ